MEKNQNHSADLLGRMLANRLFRNLMAIAIFVRVLDVYNDAGKAFYKGFQGGWHSQTALSSPFEEHLR